jgi:hypothetical protein
MNLQNSTTKKNNSIKLFVHVICMRLLIGYLSQFLFNTLDDSDHHYESLYSIQHQRAALDEKLESDKPLCSQVPNSGNDLSNLIDKFANDDDYSSFDSDDEENGNGDFDERRQAADLSNNKLPEPPQSQVYAFVQRIKNFGSISKNEISKGISKIAKKRSSLGKMPTSKFYETSDIPEESSQHIPISYDTSTVSGKKSRGLSKLSSKLGRLTINKLPTNFSLTEPFEDFTYQSTKTTSGENDASPQNNKSDTLNDNDVEFLNQKNNKSFKTRFRKSSAPTTSSSTSNIYGSLSSKNSTFYVTDSIDVDSGIFALHEKTTNSPNNSNSNLNTTYDMKRRSIAAIPNSRPKDSPPPPPVRRSGATSWYAECGLFRLENGHDEENINNNNSSSREKSEKLATSWYQESGLYQTSNNSVARYVCVHIIPHLIIIIINNKLFFPVLAVKVAFRQEVNAVHVATIIPIACSSMNHFINCIRLQS